MERNAHYALVGLLVTVLAIGLAVFVVWLARVQFSAQYQLYDVDFKGPVRGLSSGGEVYFNGIKVGEVTKLSLDRRNPDRVVARVRVGADAPVKTDSYATLEPMGITGVNYIQIAAGGPDKPLLKDVTPDDQVPVIHTRQGALEGLLEGGGDVLARSVEALDRVNRLLSSDNLAAFKATLANTRDATALLKNQGQMLSDLDATVKSLKTTSARIDTLAADTDGVLNGQGKKTLADLDAAANQVRQTTASAETAVQKLQGPAVSFATTGLPQLSRTILTLQTAAESLDRLVAEVEENPRQLLTKPPAKTVKVQP